MSETKVQEMDSSKERRKSLEMTEETTEVINSTEEVSTQPKDHSTKKPFSTLKEENDKLRTYLGLVKMCNNSAINKIRSAINETIDAINGANETPIDANVILKQLEVIQSEVMNMQSMHTQLEEGIEAFQVIDNSVPTIRSSEDSHDINRVVDNSVVLLTTSRHEVPRKSTGLRRTPSNRGTNKMKPKAAKDLAIETKLLNRIVDKQLYSGVTFEHNPQNTEGNSEEREAVSNIDMSCGEDRENVSQEVSEQTMKSEPYVMTRATKKPYISEEFKSSHLQRLEEAKRRREEMNRQLEREGKRRPKAKKSDELIITQISDTGKKSPKKRPIKKKTIGKVVKKKAQSQPTMVTAQSIVVPISQSTLDSLSGQTIQIIASGGTQILCRNDGTFIPATNSTQWQSGTQWTTATTADANNFTQNQWNQYQS